MARAYFAKHSTPGVFILIVLAAFCVRGWLWLSYGPASYSDTHSYRRLANAIHNPEWKGYDGTRTPGYPLWMALLGRDKNVYLGQLALGLATTLLLFYLGWQVSGRAWFGGVVALAHTFNLGQVFFEADLLTETPTTFWITLTLAGTAFWLYHPRRRSVWLACGLGFATTAAALTRPLFIFLPFWILLFLVIEERRLHLNFLTLRRAIAYMLPVVILFGVWVNFIHSRFHDWALTTMTGFHLVQHTGSYFEYVPDKYAGLRDTYIKYRDAQIAQHGTQANAIWDAIPEMTKVSGMTFFDLNRTLQRISVQLILKHPDLYLKASLVGWWMFWRPPFYWQPEAFRWQGMAAAIRPAVWLERLALFGANLVFILLSLAAAGLALWPKTAMQQQSAISRLRSTISGMPAFFWCLAGAIWISSILQTLLDHGDNPRFLVPLQSLVVMWVLWLAVRAFKSWRELSETR
jgi:4-amino-4-deoxy-L-arabinose transferase-like glycosyltransferase